MSQCKPKVSICIVTYNQEQYIQECLQSVVDQKVDFSIEVIISDDCSTDRTPEIIKTFADQYCFVKPVLRTENMGALKNYVDTHSLASGEYVCHLDGDDRWIEGKLEAQVNFLDANPTYSVCWSLANLFDDSGRYKKGSTDPLKALAGGSVTLFDALKIGTVAVNSSIMYRRTFYPDLDKSKEYIDLFIAWSLLERGDGKILPKAYVEYRVNAEGAITVNSDIKHFYLQHGRFFYEKRREYRKSLFSFFLTNCLTSLKSRDYRNFIGFFVLFIRSFNFTSFFEYGAHLKRLGGFKVKL